MLPKFSASQVWREMLSDAEDRVNVFMAVPTSYAKLLEEYNTSLGSTQQQREHIRDTTQNKMR